MIIMILGMLMSLKVVCGQTFQINDHMKNFIQLALDKNGDQYGFTKEDAEKILKITLNKQGSRYISSIHLPDDIEQPVFTYSARKGNRFLIYYFTEPLKSFHNAIQKLNGYEPSWFPHKQANNLPVYYFIGKKPSQYIKTRQLWIRLYECSDQPQSKCLRRAELIFGR